MEKNYMTMKEVAEILDVHAATVNRYCEAGLLTYYKIGARKRFLKKDIDKYLEGARRNATTGAKDPFDVT